MRNLYKDVSIKKKVKKWIEEKKWTFYVTIMGNSWQE